MNLKEELDKLAELQKFDFQIYELSYEKNKERPAELEELRLTLDEKKQNFHILEEKSKKLQLQKKEKELELAAKEENVKKLQTQLYQLKNNKEYQAKLNEISSAKADIAVFEEEVIKAIDAIEEFDKQIKQEKQVLHTEEEKNKLREEEITKQILDIEARLKILNDKKKILERDIDAKIITKYNQLLATRQGSAIVPVKNNCCGACHMQVTHQQINEIKMYKDLVFCQSCVRLLYIPEDES